MKWFLMFSIVAAFINIPVVLANHGWSDSSEYSSLSSSWEESPKYHPAKLMKNTVKEWNPKYYDSQYTAQIKKVNETYNALAWSFKVIEDFPMDTKVTVEVFGSETKSGNYKPISQYTLGLGDQTNKYYRYLPFGVIRATYEAKTFKKGTYEIEDSGVFRFYDLLPKSRLEFPYFKLIYCYIARSEIGLRDALSTLRL